MHSVITGLFFLALCLLLEKLLKKKEPRLYDIEANNLNDDDNMLALNDSLTQDHTRSLNFKSMLFDSLFRNRIGLEFELILAQIPNSNSIPNRTKAAN